MIILLQGQIDSGLLKAGVYMNTKYVGKYFCKLYQLISLDTS
jgi:hypothetical protein